MGPREANTQRTPDRCKTGHREEKMSSVLVQHRDEISPESVPRELRPYITPSQWHEIATIVKVSFGNT
jgi:hypothetical protein